MAMVFDDCRIITLAGMPGSGKSCVARQLATQLSYKSVDLDDEIEKMAGKSIASIFKEDGEDRFRTIEKNVLKEIICRETDSETERREPLVVALGGGTLTTPESIDLVKEKTFCIWLDTPLEIIADRLWIQQKTETRPLLTSASRPELLEKLEDIYKVRESGYIHASRIRYSEIGPTLQEFCRKYL